MRERFRLIAESSMIRGHDPASVTESDLATRAGLAAGDRIPAGRTSAAEYVDIGSDRE
ncbi:hypothetical protein TPA0910_72420 [Streptomyces hygroscopicus subsp. sporocinereus]|uniref:GntR family transcriptional regulator n=1 Tax=Streptomyces hygroscopicus TaxID=1912 RepID=A0ABQ3UB30_STRHY|nr:hypothetical protein TPA0910_72420 [Streptomyces hygroscopicus]